jgi:hypothetical protein
MKKPTTNFGKEQKEEGFKTVDEYVESVMEDIFHALGISSK